MHKYIKSQKVTCTFFKLDKNLFLWRLGTVLILVWTNYSALIPGPWYASVFDQKELAWRPAQERFKVKCFDLNHSAPIHERRWEGALWYKTRISAMQSVTCSITMQSIQKEMFRGAEGFKHRSPDQPDGSGSGKTPQGLQQNSAACEMVPIFHRNARNKRFQHDQGPRFSCLWSESPWNIYKGFWTRMGCCWTIPVPWTVLSLRLYFST